MNSENGDDFEVVETGTRKILDRKAVRDVEEFASFEDGDEGVPAIYSSSLREYTGGQVEQFNRDARDDREQFSATASASMSRASSISQLYHDSPADKLSEAEFREVVKARSNARLVEFDGESDSEGQAPWNSTGSDQEDEMEVDPASVLDDSGYQGSADVNQEQEDVCHEVVVNSEDVVNPEDTVIPEVACQTTPTEGINQVPIVLLVPNTEQSIVVFVDAVIASHIETLQNQNEEKDWLVKTCGEQMEKEQQDVKTLNEELKTLKLKFHETLEQKDRDYKELVKNHADERKQLLELVEDHKKLITLTAELTILPPETAMASSSARPGRTSKCNPKACSRESIKFRKRTTPTNFKWDKYDHDMQTYTKTKMNEAKTVTPPRKLFESPTEYREHLIATFGLKEVCRSMTEAKVRDQINNWRRKHIEATENRDLELDENVPKYKKARLLADIFEHDKAKEFLGTSTCRDNNP